MSRKGPIAIALFSLVAILTGSIETRADDPRAWGTTAAAELTRQGKEHVRVGHDELAVRRFVDALALDPSYGPAYLELGAARERAGDVREAEVIYGVALEHVPGFVDAFKARAALLWRNGERERALPDLEAASRLLEDTDILTELSDRYVETRAWPAALATWRKIFDRAERAGDAPKTREAVTHIRALSILSAELDPVLGGRESRDWVRRAEASVARRQGK